MVTKLMKMMTTMNNENDIDTYDEDVPLIVEN